MGSPTCPRLLLKAGITSLKLHRYITAQPHFFLLLGLVFIVFPNGGNGAFGP